MQANPLFMQRAIDLATENVVSGRGGPFGALIVRAGEIIAEAANCVTSTNDPTAHAEVAAIRAACTRLATFNLAGCEIYSSCEPCPMCLAAIYWAHCEAIYFGSTAEDAAAAGFDDSILYRELALPPPERRIPAHPFLREEALKSFHAWKQSAARIQY